MTPQTSLRKLLTIVCEAELENSLVREFTRHGVNGYTITDARGHGTHGTRDAAWPASANIRIEVLCEAHVALAIAERLRDTYYDNFGMVSFLSDVEVLRPEKF